MKVQNDRNNALEARVAQLEHVCGLREARPKVFEDIQNQFAEVKECSVSLESKLLEKVSQANHRIEKQQDEIRELEGRAETMVKKAEGLDSFTREIRQLLAKMGEKFVYEMNELRLEFKEIIHSTSRDIKTMEASLAQSQNVFTKQLEKVESLEAVLAKNGEEIVSIGKLAIKMKEGKLEIS